ncbi:MAG: cyclase family protein, partial [Quadrisphaera sp.]
HVDAPSHVVPGGATLDELDLALFTGPAVVVDARGHGPGEGVGWEPFAPHAEALAAGVVVLVRTGWDAHWGSAAYQRTRTSRRRSPSGCSPLACAPSGRTP